MANDKVSINLALVSDEIDRILSHVYGEYLVSGRPTKHGGLRFLDIHSARTFGFERTRHNDKGNLLTISAPYDGEPQVVIDKIKEGTTADRISAIDVRPSPDPGKEKKMFVEVSYVIPTAKVLSDKAILDYADKYKFYTTSEISRRLLHDHVVPLARSGMDHLIEVIRELNPAPASKNS
jgi:hypothetical protein